MQLVEIKIEIPRAGVDLVDDRLLEQGVPEWSLLEDAPGNRAWIVGIFPNEADAARQWGALKPLLPEECRGKPALRGLGDQDWRDSYKLHFKAWTFDQLHWVPVWEKGNFQLPAGHEVLWLDPGLAFGTGNHETTRLCVERLVTWAKAKGTGARVIDAGCGSGILALSAVKLGFGQVVAFDNDPEAVRVSWENAALNGADGKVDFFPADLVSGLYGRQAEFVMANIQADVLMQFAPELLGAVAPGGQLVLSGILANENDRVREAFCSREPTWRTESKVMGEWSDLVLEHGD